MVLELKLSSEQAGDDLASGDVVTDGNHKTEHSKTSICSLSDLAESEGRRIRMVRHNKPIEARLVFHYTLQKDKEKGAKSPLLMI